MSGISGTGGTRRDNSNLSRCGTGQGTPPKGVSHVPASRQPIGAAIADLAGRVRRLSPPGCRDPERFWRDKSEIAHALDVLAREVR